MMRLFCRLCMCLLLLHFDAMIIAQTPAQDYTSRVEWRNIGPYRGGRSCAVTGVPGQRNIYYFGSTGGGVWKTYDGGRSWENCSDGYFGGSIGSIEVSKFDPNVLYVGGGEKTVRGNVSSGYGVWKSTDAGKTWHQKGLEDSRHISRIRIHPHNENIVFAAVMGDLYKDTEVRGVYKSEDGGETWRRVLFSNKGAGAVDLVIDPTNHRNMYATTWKVRRTPYSLSSGGEGSALFKSTDGGETWVNISDKKGLPDGIWGISGVAVSPLNGQRIWAIIESEKGGVFRSDDGGESWIRTNEDRSLRQRAWYYSRIYADTQDENKVYVVNVSYHTSLDGGKTFVSKNAPHGDHHDLWIDPQDNQRMIIGDDGGAQVTYDGGQTWSTYHNQPTAQFYRVTTDDHFPYRIYAAQQDNSTIRILHRSAGGSIDEDDWESTAGGESAHIAVDPTDNEIVYGGSYGGFLTRKDHRTGKSRAINVYPDNPMGHGAEGMKYRFQWNFPIFFSKHDKTKLYACSQHLHRTTDEGQSWQTISPDLSRNEADKLVSSGGPITKDNTGVEYYATIFAAAESPIAEGLIWAGTDDGRIHLTRDEGGNWEDVSAPNMPKYLMINSIEPSPFSEGHCYVAGTLYKTGDYKPYLYKTKDFGKTWIEITKGIPVDEFTRVLRADAGNKNTLYAGTEKGMYVSYDDGASWVSLQKNLPTVPVTDITMKHNDLIIATQGRGLWILDNVDILHEARNFDGKSMHVFDIEPCYRMPGWQSDRVKGSGRNPKNGAVVDFFLPEWSDQDSLRLEIYDANGQLVNTWATYEKAEKKMEVQQGSNQWNWDLRYPGARSFDGMIMWWGSMDGPRAVPGMYELRLIRSKDTVRKSFEVLIDPTSPSTVEDIADQFEFVTAIVQKINEAHQAIVDIRTLKGQIKDRSKGLSIAEINEQIARLDSQMTVVEKALYQVNNRSGQDPLNYPIRLTNKLAHLNSLVQMGASDYKPTRAMLEVKEDLTEEIDSWLEQWNFLKSEEVKRLNDLMRRYEVDFFRLDESGGNRE